MRRCGQPQQQFAEAEERRAHGLPQNTQVRQLEQEIRPVVVVPLPEINELLSDFGGFVLCHAIAI